MTKPADPVASLLRVARTQLVMLKDAQERGLPAPALAATTLELLLQAVARVAAARAGDPSTPAAERAELSDLQALIEQRTASTVQLSSHLIELSAGWTCPRCGSDVAQGAAVSDVERGAAFLSLSLVCAECGERSKPADAGRKVFAQRFGHLAKPGWNPAANGFLHDRSLHARTS